MFEMVPHATPKVLITILNSCLILFLEFSYFSTMTKPGFSYEICYFEKCVFVSSIFISVEWIHPHGFK